MCTEGQFERNGRFPAYAMHAMSKQSELYLYDVLFHNHTQRMQSNVHAINATQAKYLHNILHNARIAGNATCLRIVCSVTMETTLEQALFLAQTNARVNQMTRRE